MIWLTIFAMAALVFTSRYLFLEPKLPLRLNHKTQRFLSFASPAILTAIWAPIVFLPHGSLDIGLKNPYLLAAVIAFVVAWKTKNTLLTTIVSMSAFFILLKIL